MQSREADWDALGSDIYVVAVHTMLKRPPTRQHCCPSGCRKPLVVALLLFTVLLQLCLVGLLWQAAGTADADVAEGDPSDVDKLWVQVSVPAQCLTATGIA